MDKCYICGKPGYANCPCCGRRICRDCETVRQMMSLGPMLEADGTPEFFAMLDAAGVSYARASRSKSRGRSAWRM